jgi:hypothetical protein
MGRLETRRADGGAQLSNAGSKKPQFGHVAGDKSGYDKARRKLL